MGMLGTGIGRESGKTLRSVAEVAPNLLKKDDTERAQNGDPGRRVAARVSSRALRPDEVDRRKWTANDPDATPISGVRVPNDAMRIRARMHGSGAQIGSAACRRGACVGTTLL